MRIAVTGAQGQLGRELCRQLGSDAIALPRQMLDVANRGQVDRVLTELRPDVVINAAAFTAVDAAEADAAACRRVNTSGAAFLAAAAKRLNATLVQVSTDYVFGDDAARSTPYRETDKPGPVNVYGQTKLAGEEHALSCPRSLIVRTCGLYDRLEETPPGRNFVRTILRFARQRPTLSVVNDQCCTPTFVPHFAAAIVHLVRAGEIGTFHVTSGGSVTWWEFATELCRLAHLPVDVRPITTAEYSAVAPRPAYSVLDIAKYAASGGPAMPDWHEALAAAIGEHRAP